LKVTKPDFELNAYKTQLLIQRKQPINQANILEKEPTGIKNPYNTYCKIFFSLTRNQAISHSESLSFHP
jgi:hypothetical protein